MCFTWVTRWNCISFHFINKRSGQKKHRWLAHSPLLELEEHDWALGLTLSLRSPLATLPAKNKKSERGYLDLEPSESGSKTLSAKVNGDLSILDISYYGIKWDHTRCDLSWLASFTQNVSRFTKVAIHIRTKFTFYSLTIFHWLFTHLLMDILEGGENGKWLLSGNRIKKFWNQRAGNCPTLNTTELYVCSKEDNFILYKFCLHFF